MAIARRSKPRLAALASAAVAAALLTGCFPSASEDDAGIYRVRPDGTGLERIAAAEARPAWSPDGARIAWMAEDGLWTANADGSDAARRVESRRGAPPAWSPDGELIAFVDLSTQELVVSPADGGDPRSSSLAVAPVATPAPIPLRDVPAWNPAGDALALVAWDGSGDELYRVDLGDGLSAPVRMTSTRPGGERLAAERPASPERAAANALAPAWSPDGTAIAFALVPQVRNGPAGVYLLEVGTGAARSVARGTPLWGPRWSPDGGKLLALMRTGDAVSLDVIDPATGEAGPIPTGDALEPREGAWSPDGARVVFSASGAIHVADLAGGTVTLLADTPLDDLAPEWSPDGEWIAFRAEPDRFPQPSLPPIP